MMQSPAASIPTLCESRSAAKAAYMLLQNEEVTHQGLLEGVFEQTAARCASQAGGVLVIQDTMAASFGGAEDRQGLGPVNDQQQTKGFLVHTALALGARTHEVLGVLDQHVWSRSSDKKPRDESAWDRRKRSRESERWSQMERQIARRLPSTHVIAVFDREGDIFEVFETVDELQHSFVIRATQNRLVASDGEQVYSLDQARTAPVIAQRTVEVPARGGGRGARVAHLQVRAARVNVQPPKNRDRQGGAQWMNIVLVEETNPPSEKEALRWFLLTREPIDTAEQVLLVVGHYEARWKIEEFHMGLKTGCSLEARQLTSDHRLKNFLAFATAIACELLKLRDVSRRTDLQASDVLTPIQLEILRETHPRITAASTALATLKAVAELGGFYGSNKDKRPGWRTLWTGFRRIVEKEKGYLLALRKTDPTAWAAAVALTPAYRIGEP
jgi:hypothetical protein